MFFKGCTLNKAAPNTVIERLSLTMLGKLLNGCCLYKAAGRHFICYYLVSRQIQRSNQRKTFKNNPNLKESATGNDRVRSCSQKNDFLQKVFNFAQKMREREREMQYLASTAGAKNRPPLKTYMELRHSKLIFACG